MSSSEADISHVSDTALMVAAARALETTRPDGLVSDPFAERLAGSRGMAILRSLPHAGMLCFGVGIRSRFLDELVIEIVQSGRISTVFSLGAGLDTRPWRLDLPPNLHWIEADFPAMLDYKTAQMSGDPPRCRVDRQPVDLTSAADRAVLFAAADPGRTLMITEGLLMYLPAESISAIAREAASAGVVYWLMDVASDAFVRAIGSTNHSSVDKVRAPGHLDGPDILSAIRSEGWIPRRHRNYQADVRAAAPERVAKMIETRAVSAPAIQRPPEDDPSGVHLFEYAPTDRKGDDTSPHSG
jgi:methyltransferase (TIGR00027 family)